MTIERVVTISGSTRITGVGYAPEGRVEHEGAELPAGPLREEQIVTLSGGSLAGDAELHQGEGGAWEIHGDPTEAAFLVAERKLGVSERRERRFERIAEIPFTAERKLMSTLEVDREQGDRVVLVTKGAPGVLLGRCRRARKGLRKLGVSERRERRFQRIAEIPFTAERKLMSTLEVDREQGDRVVLVTKGAPGVLLERCRRARKGLDVVELDAAMRRRMLAEVDALADAALRTLAVAYRPIGDDEDREAGEALEHDLVFVGIVGMIDPPREEAAKAIGEARRAGIRVMMITGA